MESLEFVVAHFLNAKSTNYCKLGEIHVVSYPKCWTITCLKSNSFKAFLRKRREKLLFTMSLCYQMRNNLKLLIFFFCNTWHIFYFPIIIQIKLLSRYSPVRIRVRIDPPHPLVCRKRRINGAVLRMRPEKLRSRVTAGVAR
jgi:hypothetical protein